MALIGVRRALIKPKLVVSSGASYTGAGDIQAFTLWGGLRAYNATKAAALTALIDVVDQAGANPATIHCKANGTLDTTALASWVSAHSVTTIKVSQLYDQVGGNHLAQATLAHMPTLTANSLNTSYALQFTAANSTQLISTSAMGANAQPYSFAMILKYTGSATGGIASIDLGTYVGSVLEYQFVSNSFRNYEGVSLDVAMSASAWHAAQAVANGASSVTAIDGSETAGNAGAQSTSNVSLQVGGEAAGAFIDGFMTEFGFATSLIPSGNRSALNSNMHGAYGGW